MGSIVHPKTNGASSTLVRRKLSDVMLSDLEEAVRKGLSDRGIVTVGDVVELFKGKGRSAWPIFKDCTPRAQEILADSIISVMAVDGILEPLGKDAYTIV